MFYTILKNNICSLILIGDENGLSNVHFYTSEQLKIIENIYTKNDLFFEKEIKQLQEYFAGTRKEFTLKLNMQGTDFQKSVWQALQQIPYGKTLNYAEIAKNISNEKACRAVGLANNKNKLPIVIPCHRVIGKNGKLVGFAGGLDVKKKLLELEQAFC